MKTIFMGTPEFAIPSLEVVFKNTDLQLIFTKEDKINARGNKIIFSSVKQFGIDNDIEIIQPKKMKDEEVINALFSKYKTQIIRWEAERVADDIVAAIKVQENLYHQAQVELKAERKKERTQKVQEFKDRIKKEFATLKSKIKV